VHDGTRPPRLEVRSGFDSSVPRVGKAVEEGDEISERNLAVVRCHRQTPVVPK
jgi:hypothetical protein